MAAKKLSISLDAELADIVRAGAQEEGVSVSTWLAEAAEEKARRRNLRMALDQDAAGIAALSDEELDRIIAEARQTSIITKPARGAA
jgi:hypothetical protein